QDRDLTAKELGAAMHQLLEPRATDRHVDRARLGNQPFAAHAACPSASTGASRPKALWSTRTARSSSLSAISALTLISLVETASRLILRSARVSNMRAASCGWERIPTPTMLTLATASSCTRLW